MARPLRITFPGALYHITTRGNERKAIFARDSDRLHFLEVLQETCDRYRWRCYAYCLMGNHYHLLVETLEPTLSRGMKHINGTYTQWFNHKYRRTGHLFQGRFHSIVVQKDRHLLELCRYIVLNPVRSGICARPEDYRWSSYLQTLGKMGSDPRPDPICAIQREFILQFFSRDETQAAENYIDFVIQGIGDRPWDRLKRGAYFGTDDFVQKLRSREDGVRPQT